MDRAEFLRQQRDAGRASMADAARYFDQVLDALGAELAEPAEAIRRPRAESRAEFLVEARKVVDDLQADVAQLDRSIQLATDLVHRAELQATHAIQQGNDETARTALLQHREAGETLEMEREERAQLAAMIAEYQLAIETIERELAEYSEE